MLSQKRRMEVIENLAFAEIKLQKGNAYQVDWPRMYVNDCTTLLDEVRRLEDKLNEEGKS